MNASLPLILGDGANYYFYGTDDVPLAQINVTSGATQYLTTDQSSSVRLLTDATGTVVGTNAFAPYGASTTTGTTTTPFKFAGQYTDTESGMAWMRARYFDPSTGQFISRDPAVALTGAAYNYTNGNPINQRDPSGLLSRDTKAAIAGFVDGLTFGASSSLTSKWGADKCSPWYIIYGALGFGTSGLVSMAAGALMRSGEAAAGIAESNVSKAVINDGKFDYLFGRVNSTAHNTARSQQNVTQLARIGVHDTNSGRTLLTEHLNDVASTPASIVRTYSTKHGEYQIRESLFSGPGGFLKLESTWSVEADQLRLTTVIPMGGS